MAKQTKNYEELKPFIPQNDNEENYALLTHYLQIEDNTYKENKFNELVKKFDFSAFQLAQAEKFYATKNVRFLWHISTVNKTFQYGIC